MLLQVLVLVGHEPGDAPLIYRVYNVYSFYMLQAHSVLWYASYNIVISVYDVYRVYSVHSVNCVYAAYIVHTVYIVDSVYRLHIQAQTLDNSPNLIFSFLDTTILLSICVQFVFRGSEVQVLTKAES